MFHEKNSQKWKDFHKIKYYRITNNKILKMNFQRKILIILSMNKTRNNDKLLV